jgi:DNA mismatch repair protein MutS
VDRVFCRVGAADNLARGESTFLVEMNETAHILRTATRRSLVIMDEIGRGTGTRDGLAIARAVCMSLLENIRARTLFATHFHELTALSHPSIANLSMDVRDTDGQIVFLKRVREGPSSNSYGIHVARLAGLPAETIQLAERLLAEESSVSPESVPQAATVGRMKNDAPPAGQAQLFSPQEMVARQIAGIQPDMMTPMEALTLLVRLKRELEGGGEK